MVLSILHETHYSYDQAVFLEPHYLSFYPKQRDYLKLRNFSLHVSPSPQGQALRNVLEDNLVHQVWFSDMVTELNVRVDMEIESSIFNPFEFLVDPQAAVPTELLAAYLKWEGDAKEELYQWSSSIWDASSDEMNFSLNLAAEVQENWEYQASYSPTIELPEACFESKMGSCRDLTWMVMSMLRYHGVPSRFVSGYAYNSELGDGHELHAWVEFYLSGVGWIGTDPMTGLLTDHRYVPVSTSHHPANTLPVHGKYRGSARASLDTRVVITEVDN